MEKVNYGGSGFRGVEGVGVAERVGIGRRVGKGRNMEQLLSFRNNPSLSEASSD